MRLALGKIAISLLYLVILCLILSSLTRSGFSDFAPIAVFLFYLFGMLVFLLSISSNILRTSNDIILFWGSIIVKLGYALFRFPISSITAPTLHADAERFWRTAVQYYEGNFNKVYTPFPFFLNFEFTIFGKNVLCCCLTNIVLSMIMVLLVLEMMNWFRIEGWGRFIAMFLSSFLIYGIQVSNSILRESIYFAFITASFASYINYLKHRQQVYVYIAILLLIPVLVLHIGYFPLAAVYLLDLFVHEKIRTKKDFLNRLFTIIVFFIFVLFASRLNSVGYLTGRTGGITGIFNRIAGSNSDEVMGEAGSRYLAGLKITSLPTFVFYSPIKWTFFMFSPLPPNWRGITDILAFLFDGCIHLMCVLLSVRCIRLLKRNNKSGNRDMIIRAVQSGLWSVIMCGFVFGLGTSTAGTAIRHRDAMIGIEAILIGISIYTRSNDIIDYFGFSNE